MGKQTFNKVVRLPYNLPKQVNGQWQNHIVMQPVVKVKQCANGNYTVSCVLYNEVCNIIKPVIHNGTVMYSCNPKWHNKVPKHYQMATVHAYLWQAIKCAIYTLVGYY